MPGIRSQTQRGPGRIRPRGIERALRQSRADECVRPYVNRFCSTGSLPLARSGRGEQQRFFRHHDPRDDIGMKPTQVMSAVISQTTRTRLTSTSKYSAKPRQTPATLRPSARTHQPGPGLRSADPNAAISANSSIVLNQFSAVVAVHGSALP